jgi:UPF0716 protein FxsA
MAPVILAALIGIPILELAVFVEVGRLIGVGATVGLTLLSSAAGLALLRLQGLATLARAREQLARNEPPIEELLDGLCILLAGALLFVPGFVTDALGLLLFIPALRRKVRRRIWGALAEGERRRGKVIEADYTVVDEKGEDAREERRRLGNGGRR